MSLRVAVIIPVGPGHEELARAAVASVQQAWAQSRGPFTVLDVVLVPDPQGHGRSAARNRGLDEHPADWHFLLDADDEMVPDAFRWLDQRVAATFGTVMFNPRISRGVRAINYEVRSREQLISLGAIGTLSMGCFVRGDLAVRFNEALHIGEDFDFYLRLPSFVKRPVPLVWIGYDRPSAGGPHTSQGRNWAGAANAVIAAYNLLAPHGLVRTVDGNYYHPGDPAEPKRLSVTDEEARLLAELAIEQRVLEIGTGLTVSTRALAATARQVVTVDPDPWVEDPKLPRVTFQRTLPEAGTFDLAFVDGAHTTAAVAADIGACVRLGIPLIAVHDTHLTEVKVGCALAGVREQANFVTHGRLALYTAPEPGILSLHGRLVLHE